MQVPKAQIERSEPSTLFKAIVKSISRNGIPGWPGTPLSDPTRIKKDKIKELDIQRIESEHSRRWAKPEQSQNPWDSLAHKRLREGSPGARLRPELVHGGA